MITATNIRQIMLTAVLTIAALIVGHTTAMADSTFSVEIGFRGYMNTGGTYT